ncbi:hypothetical protein PENSPDRAFT_658495 [Peniophora sp. CONT]|nr:hypothetical protein PENSPDRAFT_658495 [Peniophora sp. CONT]
MSITSSKVIEHNDQDTPAAVTSRPWRYLEHPDAEEWMRGPSETQTWPQLGDFVVLALNSVASVRHLDAAAQEAARQIPVRKFVAAAIGTVGLPVNDKVFHPYDYLFVRQGKPSPRLAGRDPDDVCVAIQPNDTTVGERAPIRPVHPLPWSDCYFDMTSGFPFECRSSNVKRNYIPVLPMDDDELIQVKGYVQESFAYIRQQFEDDRPDPLSAVDVSVDIAPTATREPASPHTASREPELSQSPTFAVDDGDQGDDVSIIGSEDHGSADDHSSESDFESDTDDGELDLLLRVEAMMKTEGDLRDPVVDTWYDLDMVAEVIDPILFLQDVKRLRQIMNDAEARLTPQAVGISHTDVPDNNVLEEDQRSRLGDPAAASTIADEIVLEADPKARSTPMGATGISARTGGSSPSSQPSGKSLRSRLKSVSIRLSSFARKHIRRLRSSP